VRFLKECSSRQILRGAFALVFLVASAAFAGAVADGSEGAVTRIVSDSAGATNSGVHSANRAGSQPVTQASESSPSGAQEAPPAAESAQAAGPAGAKGGRVSGVVSDQTGAVVVGATVKLSMQGGVTLTATTDAKGLYLFTGLPPGPYSLSVSAPNFKGFQSDNIPVTLGANVPLDAALEPAAAKTEEVNVQANNGAQVETLNAEVSGTITQKEVVNLGLNGRNFTQFITLTPGVSNQTGQDEAKVGVQGSVKYSVNGGRVEYNSFEVDGSDVLNAGLSGAESTLVVYPSLDSIQELKVLTSNYGAQYGRTASGTVQVTTKSGGSAWHGNAYYFLRNEAFNARNYFDPPGRAPMYRRNDLGFTIGGPVFIPGHYNTNKDRTFIFFSEEYRLEKSPSDLQPDFNAAVPTLGERQGNFSDVCPNPNDPFDLRKLVSSGLGQYLFPVASFPDCPGVPQQGIPGFRKMFSSGLPNGTFVYNNLVNFGTPPSGLTSASGIDPNALAILRQNLIPLANSYTGCSSSLVGQVDHSTGQLIMPCYSAVISVPTHWREELLRLDHNFSPKVRLSLRAIHDSWDTVTPTPNWGTVRNTFPTVQNKFVGPGVDLMVRLTQAITPSLVNETVFSFTNSTITLANQNGPGGANFQRPAGLGNPANVGQCGASAGVPQCPFGYIFNNGFGGKVPGLVVAGDNQAYGGDGFIVDPSYMPWQHTNPTYNIRDDLSKAIGKHTLQLGFQYVIAQKNETNGALGAASGDVQGLLTVSNVNGGSFNTGNAFANFLYNTGSSSFTGGGNAIQSFTQDSAQLRYYNRYQIAEPYVQDDWKVTTHLTLNLGIRFSLFGNYYEKYRRAYNWDPNAYSLSLAATTKVDPNTGQLINYPGSRPIPLDLTNLDPRITNGLVQCGTGNVPAGCAKSHVFNPAPRVGFAWDPFGNGKTSIRAGYGLFWEHGTGDEANTGSLEGSAPLVLNVTQPFPISYACIGNYGTACNPFGTISQPGAYPINVTSIPTQTQYSYSQQWSFSIQRELPRSFVTTIAYVGSKGTHLSVERQLNQLQPVPSNLNPFALHEPFLLQVPGATQGDCDNTTSSVNSPVFVLQNGVIVSPNNPASINMQVACQGQSTFPIALTNTFRPYQGFGEIYSLQNVADSSYHGFQTTLRRTKGPLTAGVAYTYSHSIDDSSDRTDPTFVNSLDLRSNKASSNFDQRHLVNVSYVYSFPKFSRYVDNWLSGSEPVASDEAAPPKASGPSRLARMLGDGWQLSGITTFQSGTPFSVINNAGSAGIGVLDNAGVANGVGAGSYPDVIPHTSTSRPLAGNNASSFGPILLNPGQFVAPRGLTFGDAGRNYLNNPNRLNFDMSLFKHFAIHEGSEIEFRVETFNIFNNTQFRIYNPDRGNTGSNTISCYGGPNYSAGAYFPGGEDCLTGSSFLHPVDAHRARTLQFAVKYSF
jgi:Carboxypeptidase regulatory-like domain